MSHSSRKAVAATRLACQRTSAAVAEAVRRFDACQTDADVRAVLIWARQAPVEWFYRSNAENSRMQAAYARARARTVAPPAHRKQVTG